MARQWTAEERQKQRELIHRVKPWKRSTGAKTVEGKAKSARNAYKGAIRPTMRKCARWLREQDQGRIDTLNSLGIKL